MREVKELIEGNLKVIQDWTWHEVSHTWFRTCIAKKLTKDGKWRKFLSFNSNDTLEEDLEYVKRRIKK